MQPDNFYRFCIIRQCNYIDNHNSHYPWVCEQKSLTYQQATDMEIKSAWSHVTHVLKKYYYSSVTITGYQRRDYQHNALRSQLQMTRWAVLKRKKKKMLRIWWAQLVSEWRFISPAGDKDWYNVLYLEPKFCSRWFCIDLELRHSV